MFAIFSRMGPTTSTGRSSYVASYCAQIDTVMHIARNSDVKLESINADDPKMMTLTIFQCIHQNLRLVYVGQQDLLANGYKLWKTLELRFQTVDQVARDIQRFFRLQQGNRSLYKFMVTSTTYDASWQEASSRRSCQRTQCSTPLPGNLTNIAGVVPTWIDKH